MQKPDIEQEVTQYLADATKMYEAWYSNVYETKADSAKLRDWSVA